MKFDKTKIGSCLDIKNFKKGDKVYYFDTLYGEVKVGKIINIHEDYECPFYVSDCDLILHYHYARYVYEYEEV